ncbi:MFS transporter [Dissulfurispira thermophila]|uniref:MFS transporter n=2 Tax=root TaxID=1 RepID=A0A7G1H0B2_9BACT|nr:MFS transporter [Dissulfurispira thermophila]BCB95988.1 MFS transporter [Dissulfurispira thermophila]
MNKKIISWCLFDFANSSYSAVIAAVIFPVYYANVIVGNETGLGDLWWGRAIAVSMAVVAISSPFLGGIADYARIRKRLLIFYSILCILSVSLFYFLHKGMVIEGFILIILANIGMEGGLVFYNSFLPEITETTHRGRVSAWGFGVGYAGSIVSLLLAMLLVNKGLVNITWPMVALFFGVFSIPAFLFLPKDKHGDFTNGTSSPLCSAATDGLIYTWKTFKKIWTNREQRKFLIAYLIYEDGVNTVIVFSSIFAATTLLFRPEELIGMYLIVQTTALIGAFLMARPIDYWGPKKVIIMSLVMWVTVSIAAFFVQTKMQFFIIASIAGLGLGTIQAASRAFYTQFIPAEEESEYFGVYSFIGKSSAILGPLVFGYLSSTFGSQRPAVLSVALFFLAGLIIVKRVKGGMPNVEVSGKTIDERI